MKLPEPVSRTFTGLISDIEKGQIKIPQFQRDFVWDIKKSSKLMDSIIKGYPIGTFIFWKTDERLRSVRNLGNFKLPPPNDGDFIDYVLDGQQRLTSLFASLKGIKISREEGKLENYDEMYVNLEATEDDEIVIIDKTNFENHQLIKLNDLLYGSISLLNSYDTKYHTKLDDYRTRINSYNYSIILIRDAPLDIATEIFTRINEGGKPLTVFEIMVAKTFDAEKNFDLAEKFEKLIDDLTEVGYDTISDAIVLQTISLLLDKECKRQTILKLNKKKFIEIWPDAIDAIEKTVDYFRGFYRIPVSQLLPYNALIVPFAYFFYHHKDKPTGNKQKFLQDFFWRVSLGTRYSSAVESKLAQDIKRIDSILNDELPRYDWTVDTSPEIFDKTGFFSTSSSWIKSILCIYAYHQPKSFNDSSIVHISNDWLKQANSKNYHHFFPRAYLDKKLKDIDYKNFWINHILNITIVDDFLNKREIKAKAPSIYMRKFSRHNKEIDETMKSHLINDIEKYGIWEDDYDRFLKQRARAVSREMKKRIIEQDSDMTMKAEVIDELDQVSEIEGTEKE
ncbi:MAG: DUF262 domain-containing protein [Cyclobacteriaceae bacterium]|nr:DUF262 domain-containing protein [Cyclobacteriaceae bacterium]